MECTANTFMWKISRAFLASGMSQGLVWLFSTGGDEMPPKNVVKHGDVNGRVGGEVIRARGVDVAKLIKMLVANAAAEFASTYSYYTILRMHLAGYEEYTALCQDTRLGDRAHW